MEVSFQTPELRKYWIDPQGDDLDADTMAIAKQLLEDVATAASPDLLEFVYDVAYRDGTLTFTSDGGVALTCLVDPSRVRAFGDDIDLSHVTRIQVVSIDKIGGGS